MLLGSEVASQGKEDHNRTVFNYAARGYYRIAVFFWALPFEVELAMSDNQYLFSFQMAFVQSSDLLCTI